MGFFRVLLRQDNIEIGTLAAAVGSFMFIFGKNAYLGKKWVQFTGKKNEDGELVPVEPVLKFRFESVLQKFEFTEWNKRYINLYINADLDPNAIGSTSLRQGIQIGVPEYYQHLSDDSIKRSVEIKNQSIDWDSSAGKRFLESLKLGEYAQKYIIACNVALVDSHYASIDAVMPGFMLAATYSVGNRLYSKFLLRHKPFALTVAVYAVQLSFFLALYMFLNDALFTVYFKAAEDRASGFGAQYIKGSIEYYKKKIERNKALRELLPNGRKHYTEDGNEVGVFRVKGLLDTFKLVMATERGEQFEFMEEVKKPPIPNPNPHPIHG